MEVVQSEPLRAPVTPRRKIAREYAALFIILLRAKVKKRKGLVELTATSMVRSRSLSYGNTLKVDLDASPILPSPNPARKASSVAECPVMASVDGYTHRIRSASFWPSKTSSC